ncbi:hypothetical protein SNK03_002798 [Fusarium graminearum]|uniref:Chromosome 1, complete genome n=1 Tax=Gibberella zeae (strain ATCC MYA-4620 / CBS 123657 / FGSC 9075 / NRRL 31084 / PH-1) TaxID=229533 RepID=I1RFG0_GIBZE|nr:hypothetical protein FGSG_02434 [Fusarium graminearum PH-1]ESU07870.1 hypothetical protein FGSG_02434 [Fusarium graminearum PH-1]EYB31608.1 hypothetical protein FG05_02434 [Fusarium graminearum]CAF3452039.1 unnamed protein product [Fusarium graminearum]CEF74726.1 unnamed protein product [Fusarium graminearum]|eukprot:XP_011318355.1 hypothetical protein FGSG_02434 [Fusarium graminearum PH-1]
MERPDLDLGQEPQLAEMTCCCGRIDCALLKRNCTILETVEKDVHTAAQLGQALLARHEAYMADAERDRLSLSSRIEHLEMAKQELEAENALKIEENRNLLDQLELLNNTVSESDTRIKTLEASLLSSQQAVRKLESAALRAEDAERHIHLLELEQDDLYHELRSTKEDARSHAQRCKEAQRGIMDMQDQLERMEEEAREERERHAEVVGRMERQRRVEKQLDTAAGRLKGAAASKTLQEPKPGNPVVNHFVRDLLQDNANLQLGMAELREMLLNSNDEIQCLREQLIDHQPAIDSRNSTLKDELEAYEPPTTPRYSQELHIHHHYHVTPKADKAKVRKKRASLNSSVFSPSPTSGASTPRSSARWSLGPALPVASINTKEPNSVISMPKQRWSLLSEQPSDFASSVPSSPRSNQRNSLFDSAFGDNDYPMSPATSFDPVSPSWRTHRKGPSDVSAFSLQAPSLQLDPGTPPPNPRQFNDNVIHEEDEDEKEESTSRAVTPDLGNTPSIIDESSVVESSEDNRDDYMPRPRIHRALSHESIMSLSGGLDIHTLKARPSQLTLRPLGGAEAVLTGVTAQPTLYRGAAKRSTAALRDNFAGLPTSRTTSNPLNRPGSNRSLSPAPSDTTQGSAGGGGGIGKWVGWRPWASTTASENIPSKAAEKSRDKGFSRSPGINQPGAIPGFHQYWAAQKRKGAPAQVTTVAVDHEALVEGLEE